MDKNQDVASAIMFIIAKLDGEMTRETKLFLEEYYQNILSMDAKDASATLKQNSFMLEQYPIVRSDLKKVLNNNCVAKFNSEQATQLVNQLTIIAARETNVTSEQQLWIDDVSKLLESANSQLF